MIGNFVPRSGDAGSISIKYSGPPLNTTSGVVTGGGSVNRKYAVGIVGQPRRAGTPVNRLVISGVMRGFGNAVRSGAPVASSRTSDGNGKFQYVSGVLVSRSKYTVGESPQAINKQGSRRFIQIPSCAVYVCVAW